RSYFGEHVYATLVPRSVRLSEAPGFGLPIARYDPSSTGARAYRALAEEFMARDIDHTLPASMPEPAAAQVADRRRPPSLPPPSPMDESADAGVRPPARAESPEGRAAVLAPERVATDGITVGTEDPNDPQPAPTMPEDGRAPGRRRWWPFARKKEKR